MHYDIQVVNRRDIDEDSSNVYYVGRPTPLGNPFTIGRDGTREEVVGKYADWLYKQEDLSPAMEMFDNLLRKAQDNAKRDEPTRLACWCAPATCHADVIRDAMLICLVLFNARPSNAP